MRIPGITAISLGLILLIAAPAFASGVPYSVSGTVIDVHGDPVKGANVSLLAIWPMDSTQQIMVINTTLTNDTGYYSLVGTTSERVIINVAVSYDDGNKTFYTPHSSRHLIGLNPENNSIVMNSSETQFFDYPPATEGFVRGAFYTNDTPFGERASGTIYLVSADGKRQYDQAINASKGSYFTFHVPPGNYQIYAASDIKDLRYTSRAQNITVVPSWTLDYASFTYEVTKDYGVTTGVTGVPFTMIYLEPASRQLIMPTPAAANMSAMTDTQAPPTIPAAVEVAAGGAVVASGAYILFKFLGIGAVLRASARLDKNKNRNDLFKFIADNPGVTLHDTAHAMDMNLGTIRYHLLILGLNHRIVSSKFDDKFVRYFTNSGYYTKSDQLIISMVRRDGVRNVLSLLLSEPGLTNAGISDKLGMRVSATSRYIKELLEKGLVSKAPQENGALTYSIDGGLKENIVRMMARVNSA